MHSHALLKSVPSDARRRQLLAASAGAFVAALLPRAARAAAWPSKPITLVSAQAPGASTDGTTRAYADYFTQQLGVPVVVENRPGGVGTIASSAVARSAPDGHMFLVTLHSQLAQSTVLLKKPPIDPSKDLVPIASIGTGVGPMVVAKNLPVNNLKELIELARKRPVTVGNFGIGSGWQLQMTQLAQDTGAQFVIVNYKGTGPMLVDLLGGHIEVGAGSMAGLGGAIQNGGIRPIMVITGQASKMLPGLPTWNEAGIVGPAFQDLIECNMLLGPTGTPVEVVARLAQLATESVTQGARMKAFREQLGGEDAPLTGEALRNFIERSWPTYQAMTRKIGITAE